MRKRFASVWDAIEDDPAQRENMKVRSALMTALKKHIDAEGMTQSQAAKRFGVTQPRISDLMRGKINLFAIDSLVNMIGTAGLNVKMQIERPHSALSSQGTDTLLRLTRCYAVASIASPVGPVRNALNEKLASFWTDPFVILDRVRNAFNLLNP